MFDCAKGHGYTDIYLLSYFELERALERNSGRHVRIALPDVRAYSPNAPASIVRLVETLHDLPAAERVALSFFPTHIALARG